MSILDTIKKGYLYTKTSAGFLKLLPRTLAELVSLNDGSNLENTISSIKTTLNSLKTGANATVVNNLTTTASGTVLDGRQGKVLNDTIGSLSSLSTSVKTSIVNAINSLKIVVDGKLNTKNVVNNLTTTAQGYALDARQGSVIAAKLNTANVINNLVTTAAGYALDARQGKALSDKITTLNSNITPTTVTLATGVRLTRCGRHRVLHIVEATSAADGTIATLPARDRPANYVMCSATYKGQTRGDYFVSVTPATGATVAGKVGMFYGGNHQQQVTGPYIVACLDWYV